MLVTVSSLLTRRAPVLVHRVRRGRCDLGRTSACHSQGRPARTTRARAVLGVAYPAGAVWSPPPLCVSVLQQHEVSVGTLLLSNGLPCHVVVP